MNIISTAFAGICLHICCWKNYRISALSCDGNKRTHIYLVHIRLYVSMLAAWLGAIRRQPPPHSHGISCGQSRSYRIGGKRYMLLAFRMRIIRQQTVVATQCLYGHQHKIQRLRIDKRYERHVCVCVCVFVCVFSVCTAHVIARS